MNYAVLGELGFYNQHCKDNIPLNNENWAFHVKRTIDELCLSDLWFEQNLNVAFSHSFNKELKTNSFSNGNQKKKIPVYLNTLTNTKLNLA